MFAVETANASELNQGGGGNTLLEPCTAHVTIIGVKVGVGPGGTPIDGFTAELDVLGGKPTNASVSASELVGKTLNLIFAPPDTTKSEKSQAMTRRKNTNFCLATGLLTPQQLGQSVDINPEDAVGRHMIVRLEKEQKQEGDKWVDGKWLRVAYDDIYHVDDPEVASIPKNVAALKYIPTELRRKPEWFAYKAKGQTGAPAAKAATAATAPVAGGVEVDV